MKTIGADRLTSLLLRYACDTIGVALMVGMASVAVFTFFKMPRVPRASLLWIIVLSILLVCLLLRPNPILPSFEPHY